MLSLLFKIMSIVLTSLYTVHFNDIDGADRSFSSFEHKKILIVNIATNSNYANQLGKLEQLYQQYHDDLVIVAFPSNSFGNEARSNIQIKEFCHDNYNTTFTIAEKNTVAGDSLQAIYSWLADQNKNGAANVILAGDFQKVLIDDQGSIIGLFAPEVDPLDIRITDAITE